MRRRRGQESAASSPGPPTGSCSFPGTSAALTSSRSIRPQIYVQRGGSAVYDILVQKQYELAVTHQSPDRFIVLPYFHPPYYTLLIAPLAFLDYRTAYYAMTTFNVVLAVALALILVRGSERVHGRGVIVATALIAGFLPLFVTILQGQSDLVVLVPLAAAYTAWARGRTGWAGVFSALALS